MSDYSQSTSPPVDRRRILTDAHLAYRQAYADLRKADQRLREITKSLKLLSEGEQLPYLREMLTQRESINRAFRSMDYTINKLFPQWVRRLHGKS